MTYATTWIQTKDKQLIVDNVKTAMLTAVAMLEFMTSQLKTRIPENTTYQIVGDGNGGGIGTLSIYKYEKSAIENIDEDGEVSITNHAASEMFKLITLYEHNTLQCKGQVDMAIVEAVLFALSIKIPQVVKTIEQPAGILDEALMKKVVCDVVPD